MGFYTSVFCLCLAVEAGRPGLVRLTEEGGRHPGITQGRLQAWLRHAADTGMSWTGHSWNAAPYGTTWSEVVR